MENMSIYSQLCVTPQEAKKNIEAGRLKGFTDINPMWRIKRLTEVFGPCGFGWLYRVTQRELREGADGEVKAFVQIELQVRVGDEWSSPIYGEGGASFVSKERGGYYTDDEAYKKATTDAIGSACKLLGMSADIYYSKDRTKYTPVAQNASQGRTEQNTAMSAPEQDADAEKKEKLRRLVKEYALRSGLKSMKEAYAALKEETGKPVAADSMDWYIDYLQLREVSE